jgi:hypothetical protein
MRPTPLRFAFAAALLVAAVGPAPAQFGFAPRAAIEKPRVGFRPADEDSRDAGGNRTPVSKIGLWAPVSVGVEFGKMKGYKGGILLEVSTTDCDHLTTTARFPIIPATAADPDSDEYLLDRGPGVRRDPRELTGTGYVRLSSDTAEVRLRLVEEGDPEKSVSETLTVPRDRCNPRAASKYVVLALGGPIPGLEFAHPPSFDKRVERATLGSVQELPDQWFGYEAADLVVLPTGGNAQFVADLFNSADPTFARKRRALFEWVRRGGKLVVAAGERADAVAASPEFSGYEDKATKEWVPGILPVQVAPAPKVSALRVNKAGGMNQFTLTYPRRALDVKTQKLVMAVASGLPAHALAEPLPPGLFSVAALKETARKTPYTTLLTGSFGRPTDKPADNPFAKPAAAEKLAAQAAFGLGRVTVVAFDIDRSPFTDPANAFARTEFWEWLLTEAGDRDAPRVPEAGVQPQPRDDWNRRGGGPQSTLGAPGTGGEDGVVSALRGSIDYYDEVPVISFGWVALFILGYTLVIGPIEYVLLKKLLGKLELTWITFPIIVLTVSGAAYATAYAVKGKDLRMNKIDVVDIDLRTDPARPRVYGRTWFTIFSPRIDSYTIGVEPKDNWAKTRDDRGYTPVTTVDWFGLPPKDTRGGGGRGYQYSIDPRGDGSPQANGVSGVPIQVWGTKAFAANWSGVADPANPPVKADVRQEGENGDRITGTVTYNLTLKDVDQALLVYRGKVYPFEKAVVPGLPVPVSIAGKKTEPLDTLFQNDPRFVAKEPEQDDYGPWGRQGKPQQKAAANDANKDPLALWGMLFHQQVSLRRELQNGGLRPLDQSWRLSDQNDSEVILLFKLKRAKGQPAEELMADPDSPSPTRVWLHGLPGKDAKQQTDGVVQQDTYVRVYLPVKKAGAK